MENQEINLEGLLSRLCSDEAKGNFINKLGEKKELMSIQAPIKGYEEDDEEYEERRWKYAAEVAEKLGMIEEAIRFYEKAAIFAGECDYLRAIHYNDAIRVAKKAGMTERIIEIFEKTGKFGNAARVAKKAGMTKKANQLYVMTIRGNVKRGYYDSAAKWAQEAGMTKKAIRYYKKAGRSGDAAELAREAGMIGIREKVVGYFKKIKEFNYHSKATKIAQEAKKTKKAIEDYEKEGNFIDAARIAKETGMTERADLYTTLEKLLR